MPASITQGRSPTTARCVVLVGTPAPRQPPPRPDSPAGSMPPSPLSTAPPAPALLHLWARLGWTLPLRRRLCACSQDPQAGQRGHLTGSGLAGSPGGRLAVGPGIEDTSLEVLSCRCHVGEDRPADPPPLTPQRAAFLAVPWVKRSL